jgi:hypothetical protein
MLSAHSPLPPGFKLSSLVSTITTSKAAKMYPGSSFLALAIFIGAAVTLNVHPRNDLTYRGTNALVVREAQGYGVYGYGTTTTTTSASGAASSTTASTSAPSSSSSTLAASSTASGSPTTSYSTTAMTGTTTSTVSSGSSSGVTTAVGPTLTSVYVAESASGVGGQHTNAFT